MEKSLNKEEIKEIAVNPMFVSKEDYETLINQGFQTRWMTEEEQNAESNFLITVDESK